MFTRSCAAFLGVLAAASVSGATLDPAFGSNGRMVFELGGVSADLGNAILQSDGKIVVAGNSPALPAATVLPAATADFIVARFNRDGTPDTGFGDTGVVRIDFNGSEDAARALVQQPDGKLVIAGWAAGVNDDFDFAVARLLPDGTLDSSFSDDGKATINFGFRMPDPPDGHVGAWPIIDAPVALNKATTVSLQDDGHILIGGYTAYGNFNTLSVARLLPGGEPDTSYGSDNDGKFSMYGGNTARLADMHVEADGELVVVGTLSFPRIVLGRINTGGDSGSFTYPISPTLAPWQAPSAMLRLPDGKLLIGGVLVHVGSRLRMLLARADTDFGLDPTFANAGLFTTDDALDNDAIVSLQAETNGKVIAAGHATANRNESTDAIQATLWRFSRDGAPDTTFGENGAYHIDFSAGTADRSSRLRTVLRGADGKLIVVGTRGSVDPSYGSTVLTPDSRRIVLARVIATPTFDFATDTATIAEGAAPSTITVSRVGETTGPVSVDYSLHAGSALAGEDFAAMTGTLTWEAGDPEVRTIDVSVMNDSAIEADETFFVELSNPSEGSIARSRITVTIVDDDGPAPPSTDQPDPPTTPAPSNGNGTSGGGGGHLGWLSGLALLLLVLTRVFVHYLRADSTSSRPRSWSPRRVGVSSP